MAARGDEVDRRTVVAIFTDSDADKVTGITTTLRELVNATPKLIQARIYTASNEATETNQYFAARGLGIGLPWYRSMRVYVTRVVDFERELRRNRPHVIHITTPGPVGLIARSLAHRMKIPLTGSYHTHFAEYANVYSGSIRFARVCERYLRWFYRPCRLLFVPSRATYELLNANGYDCEAGRVRLWHRGVNSDTFSPVHRSREWRQRHGASDRTVVLLYVGRLSSEKGLLQIPELLRLLKSTGADYRFVFVGDGPLRATLMRLCPDAYFDGFVEQPVVAVAMASSDIFVFPSTTDSFGNVVLEAQASGMPVVVSDRGGPKECVLGGQTALISRGDDSESLVASVSALLRDPVLRTRMGRCARHHAMQFTWARANEAVCNGWTAVRESSSTS